MANFCGFWSTFSVIPVGLIDLGLFGDRGEARAGEKAILIWITCGLDALEPALLDTWLDLIPSCVCLLFSPSEREGSWLLCP